MDKVLQVICKYNKFIDIDCQHCKKGNKIATKEFFKGNSYELACSHCNETTICDTSLFANDLKKQFKKMGIKY